MNDEQRKYRPGGALVIMALSSLVPLFFFYDVMWRFPESGMIQATVINRSDRSVSFICIDGSPDSPTLHRPLDPPFSLLVTRVPAHSSRSVTIDAWFDSTGVAVRDNDRTHIRQVPEGETLVVVIPARTEPVVFSPPAISDRISVLRMAMALIGIGSFGTFWRWRSLAPILRYVALWFTAPALLGALWYVVDVVLLATF
jgi:hypothetical protein